MEQKLLLIFSSGPVTNDKFAHLTYDAGDKAVNVPIEISDTGVTIGAGANPDYIVSSTDMNVTAESMGLGTDLGVDTVVVPDDTTGVYQPDPSEPYQGYADARTVLDQHFKSLDVGLESTKEFFADTVPATKFADLNYELMVSNYDDYFDEMVDFG